MRFQTPLQPATLLRRYNRFLSDMQLPDGSEVRAHCPNPGSMMGLKEPGLRCWIEPNDDPKKKLKFGWRLVELPNGTFVGIDTGAANRVVAEALGAGQIAPLADAGRARAEVKYGKNSRVDFLLGEETYVEVKSVTLSRSPALGEFPDSVTARGAKHLAELSAMVAQGKRAVLLYLVQRTDCEAVSMAGDIDPTYGAAFAAARAAGVEFLAYDTQITPEAITLGRALPVRQG